MSLLRIKQADGSWSNIPAIKGADGIDGKDGAIQYTAGRYIQIDEDTQTINCTVKIGDLVIIDAVPVKDSTNVVSSGGVYDALETKADKTEIAGLGGEAGFITNSVEDLKNYYKKSETYSQEEVNSLIGNLTRLTLQVVQELPEVGTEHIIYLVSNGEAGNNVYEEWIFVQAKWEMIGTTEVDLSNYYTKEEIDALIASSNSSEQIIYTIDVEYLEASKKGPLGSNTNYMNQLREILPKVAVPNELAKFCLLIRATETGTSRLFVPVKFTTDWSYKTTTVYFINSTAGEPCGTNESLINETNISQINIEYYNETLQPRSAAYSEKKYKFLASDNTSSYTPTGDYHPATKKYVDDKVLDAIPQRSEMPEASADYLDKVYQYIGEDTEEFTKGFFYQCIETQEGDTTVYSWSELKFNTSSSDSEGDTIIVKLEGYFNQHSYTANKERYSGVTLTANDRQTLTNVVNKYYNGYEFTKEILLQTNGKLFRICGWSNGSSSGGKTNLTVYLSPAIDVDGSNFYKAPMSLNKFDMCFEGSLGSYTPYYNSSLSYWWTDTYVIPYLHKENRIAYTPTSDYNPATKKYVDDAVANAGGGGNVDLSGYVTKEDIDKLPISELEYLVEIDVPANASDSYSLDWTNKDRIGKAMTEAYAQGYKFLSVLFNRKGGSLIKLYNIVDPTIGYDNSPIERQAKSLYLYSGLIIKGNNIFQYVTLNCSFTWTDNVCSCTNAAVTTIQNIKIYQQSDILTRTNEQQYTPTGYYNPATKKYVDDAVAKVSGGSGADLSNYYNKEEVDAKVAPLVSATDVLTKTNTTEYTPASAYHPATKQYVDQTVSSMGGITEESDPTVPLHVKNITKDMISKWNNAPTEEDVTNAATAAVNGAGFVKTETDPAFTASAAFKILDSDLDNWNAKADLADIDSALLTALGGTYSTELASNPAEGSVILTMTDDLKELATKISNGVANDKPPKVTLKVTFDGMEEDLVFTPTNYNKPDGKCWFKAIVMNTPDTDYSPHNPAACSIATLYAYYLNATNKALELSYSSMTSIHDLNEANWVNATISSTGDVPGMPNYSMGLHSNGALALTTTLDLAYLNEFHEFLPWTGTNAPTTKRDKIVLGILGNKLCIDWGYNGTRLTKGYYQTFSEMMEAIKVKDESSDDYGKYILAESFIAPSGGGVYVYNAYGQELEHDSISEIFSFLYDYQYDRVYLRGSDSGQIIVAQLKYDDAYTVNNSLYPGTYRITLEIDPDENKALASSTVDLGQIVGMHSLQTFSPVYNKFSYKGLLPNFTVNEDGYIRYVTFVSIDQGKPAIWS